MTTKSVPKKVVFGLSLCALSGVLCLQTRLPAKSAIPRSPRVLSSVPKPDVRVVRLTRYFSRLNCPVVSLAGVFISAADKNQLDWRLLPSISVVESSGGKAYRNNNIFGWDSGLYAFPSISSGIETIAGRLAHSPLYRNRDLVGKLRIYNPNESYVHSVLTVMNRISPAADVKGHPATILTQQD